MFGSLLITIENGISAAFSWAEDLFSSVGIVLIVLVLSMTVSGFFVSHFISPFFK